MIISACNASLRSIERASRPQAPCRAQIWPLLQHVVEQSGMPTGLGPQSHQNRRNPFSLSAICPDPRHFDRFVTSIHPSKLHLSHHEAADLSTPRIVCYCLRHVHRLAHPQRMSVLARGRACTAIASARRPLLSLLGEAACVMCARPGLGHSDTHRVLSPCFKALIVVLRWPTIVCVDMFTLPLLHERGQHHT